MSDWKKLEPLVRQTSRWDTLSPIGETVVLTQALFDIPAFNQVSIWKGASSELLQFNYVAARVFTLPLLPLPPSDVDFCPCIRYRVGTTVYRWKLWQSVGEVLWVDLYGGQRIKPNFSIEIWNTELNPQVSYNGTQIKTSMTLATTLAAEAVSKDDLYYATGPMPFVTSSKSPHLTN